MSANEKQVYIVDDDESVCRALQSLLVTFGFEVTIFYSAEKFFSAIPNSVKGCLVMDIHMPGLNGCEAQQRLIKSGSKRPVIIITADKNSRLREQAFKMGAVGFLQKPFNDHELVCFVNKANRSEKVLS